MNIHLSDSLRYLESHQREFEKLIKDALSSTNNQVQFHPNLYQVVQQTLMQAYSVLKEVEQIQERKLFNQMQSRMGGLSGSQPELQELNFVQESILLKIEEIQHESRNVLVQYWIFRIIDIMLKNKLVTFENKETGNLIYFINNIFGLHDAFIGSFVSKRMTIKAKALLNYALKRKDITEDQEDEIKEQLELPNLRGSEIFNNVLFNTYLPQFEQEILDLKKIIKSNTVQDKINALNELIEKMSATQNLQEQLSLFASKCQMLLKLIFKGVKETDEEIFTALSNFLQTLIFETDYYISIEVDQTLADQIREKVPESVQVHDKERSVMTKLYTICDQKEVLVNCEGLYTSIAIIINFFLSFPNKINIQHSVLIIFKRLWNNFPEFRKRLEDPIITVLINIHDKCARLLNEKKGDEMEMKRISGIAQDAQMFLNYLITEDDTEAIFKEKIFSRKEMKEYLTQKNLGLKPNPKCTSLMSYNDLNLKIGYPQKYDIAAGSDFFQIVEVEEPDSIIFCGFQTTTLDIMFGFFKIIQDSELSSEDELSHVGMEEIFGLTKIESAVKPIKVSYIAKEPGLYKIIWSNEHSWFKSKTLKYRISILKPTHSSIQQNQFELIGTDIPSLTSIPSSKRKAIQKLIEIPRSVIKTYTNIDVQQRKTLSSQQFQEQIYFILVDLEREIFKISNNEMQEEQTHDLESLEDISFILDELLHTLMEGQKLQKPTSSHYVKIFLLMSKSKRSQELIQKFDHKTVKFLQNAIYDIYLLFDTDSNVICQALSIKESQGKSKKKLLSESSLIFIKADDLNFISSMCLRQKIVQDDKNYSFEVGNIGSLDLMTEESSSVKERMNSDEVSGGLSPNDSAQKTPMSGKKNFCNKKLSDVWQDARSVAIALTNYQKICGCKVMVHMCFGDIEEKNHEHNQEKYRKYLEQLNKEINTYKSEYDTEKKITVEMKNENTYIFGMRNIYKFLEIHQQQYWE